MAARQRDQALEALSLKPHITVLIIGGGINGAALMRELALQNIDSLLVDKGDFSSGASSACSRMVHGGLRYLESGDIALVKEALHERNLLLKNAPHLVTPILTNIPIFSLFSGFTNFIRYFLMRLKVKVGLVQRGALIIKIGLLIYDFITRNNRCMPKHRFLFKKKSLEKSPCLSSKIIATAQYSDAYVSHPEQVIMELIEDALRVNADSMAVNYLSCKGLENNWVILQDEQTSKTYKVQPKLVVNATGAWVDFTNRKLNETSKLIGGTKGSHIIVENSLLRKNLGEEMFLYENQDGRICIILPYDQHVLIGTTDIAIDNPDQAMCSDSEIQYIINSVKQLFPSIQITGEQIIAFFSGVRPLKRSEVGVPGGISRRHDCIYLPPIKEREFPLYMMVGGKWTTFRSFSALVADRILADLKLPRLKASINLAIGGGKFFLAEGDDRNEFINDLSTDYGLDRLQLQRLYKRYGSGCVDIIKYISQGPDKVLPDCEHYSEREIRYILEMHRVVRIEDLLLRRTKLVFQGYLTKKLFDALMLIAADVLAWSDMERLKNSESAIENLKCHYGITL